MKAKEFSKLKKGDIIVCKGRKAKIHDIGYTLVEIQYLETGRRAWKTARQITIKEG